jgi:hypothetical protein
VSRFVTTARVLRLLVSGESPSLDGDIEVLRSVFRTGAEACERLDETDGTPVGGPLAMRVRDG